MNSAYRFIVPAFLLTCLAAGSHGRCDESAEQPYVYKNWEHFTVKDGLPNDHIFAVKVHEHLVWIGIHVKKLQTVSHRLPDQLILLCPDHAHRPIILPMLAIQGVAAMLGQQGMTFHSRRNGDIA